MNSNENTTEDNIDPKIHRQIVVDLINVFAPHGVGIEIGVKKARTSSVILKDTTTQHIFLIDPWEKRQGEAKRVARIAHGFPGRVTILRKKSESAIKNVPDELDFIWIDGNHSYDFVMKDLELWIPKVCPGGLILGHDWGERYPDVERAVVDYVEMQPTDLPSFAPLTGNYERLKHEHLLAPEANPVVNISKHGNIWWALKNLV